MKTFFLMMVLINPENGNEQLDKVNSKTYSDYVECVADKAHYKENEYIKFYCVDSTLVKKK